MNYQTQQCEELVEAHLTLKRKRLKNYNNNFYLKDKQEFEIEFFNRHSQEIAVEVSYNNVTMPNKLVIRPGERIWLERFLEDNKKLMFETYNVDKEAEKYIKDNGNLILSFYHKTLIFPYYTYAYSTYNYPTFTYDSTGTITHQGVQNTHTSNTFQCSSNNQQIETGRITKGNDSDQLLVNCNIDFTSFSFNTINYKLLPYSQKSLTSKDIRKYCNGCGIRIRKQTWEFCPKCGTKI